MYYRRDNKQEFFIPASLVPEMQKAIIEKFSSLWYWEQMLVEYQKKAIEDAFNIAVLCQNWQMTFDQQGNAIALNFAYEASNLGEDLLEVIAPFVKEGSYVEMDQDEDDYPFRIIFVRGTYNIIHPKLVWSEEDIYAVSFNDSHDDDVHAIIRASSEEEARDRLIEYQSRREGINYLPPLDCFREVCHEIIGDEHVTLI